MTEQPTKEESIDSSAGPTCYMLNPPAGCECDKLINLELKVDMQESSIRFLQREIDAINNMCFIDRFFFLIKREKLLLLMPVTQYIKDSAVK